MAPLFSIILPTYNRGDRIEKAIQSVLDQTYSNWELIIVDDGSTDNTKEICLKYQDPRISYHYQDNAERSAARNKGIAYSGGDYIGFLDSDDTYLPSFLENVQNLTKELTSPSLLFSGLAVNLNNTLVPQPIPDMNTLSPQEFLLVHSMATPRAVIHRDCFQKAMFPVTISIGEDRHLWVRLANYFPVRFCPEAVVVQNDYGDRSISSLRAVKENYLSLCATIQTKEGQTLNAKTIAQAKGRALLALVRWHVHNQNRIHSIFYVSRSLLIAPFDQSRFKVNLLLRLLLMFPFSSICALF